MKLYLILFLSFMIVINFGYTQPVNDNLSNSIDITSLINSCSADADYTNINSTSDQDNGSCWDTIGGSNVWFNFTAPASGEIKVEILTGGIEGSIRFQYITIWENDGATEVACTRWETQYGDQALNAINLIPDNNYYISVDNNNLSTGYRGTFKICLGDAVDYDYYEGAIMLADINNWCSSNEAFTTEIATFDRNQGSCWGSSGGSNRWFSFVATTTQINIKVKTGGSEGTLRFAYVALWEQNGTTEIGCASWRVTYSDLTILSNSLTPGNTYYISVDNHNTNIGYRGTFSLCVDDDAGHDLYDTPVELTDMNSWCSGDEAFTTENATADKNTGSCWSTSVNSNVWFKFTAVYTDVTIGLYTGGSEGTLRYPHIALWEADGVTELACQVWSAQYSDLTINYSGLTVSNTYYISVDNNNSNVAYQGTFKLCINNIDESFYSLSDGNWDTASNWSLAGYGGSPEATNFPKFGDVVYISGYHISVDADQNPAEINLEAHATQSTSLTVDGAGVLLNVDGEFNMTNTGINTSITTNITNGASIYVNDYATFTRDGGNTTFDLTASQNSSIEINMGMVWNNSAGSTNSTMNLDDNATLIIGEDLDMNFTGGSNKILFTFNTNSSISVARDIIYSALDDDQIEITLNNATVLQVGRKFVRPTPAYGILTSNGTSTVKYKSNDYLQSMASSTGSGTGDTFTYQNITIDNTRITTPQIVLDGPVTINSGLTLTNGIVLTTAANLLTLADNVSITGGSAGSYIDGPLKKIGDDAITFPIGNNNRYARLGISAPDNVTAEFTAEYLNSKYSSTLPVVGSLDHVSGFEHWKVTRDVGASPADDVFVTLYWEFIDSEIDDLSKLMITHWNGSIWEDKGNGSSSGGASSGSITSSVKFNSFSPVTFASTDPVANPLPITLFSFTGNFEDADIKLKWITANEFNNAKFTIEHSDTGEDFEAIGIIQSKGNANHRQYYSFTDSKPDQGINYYRLKQTDFDGKFSYFSIISVIIHSFKSSLKVYPNPTDQFLNIKVSEDEELIIIQLRDAQGKLIKEISGNQLPLIINMELLIKGIYFLKVTTNKGEYNETVIRM